MPNRDAHALLGGLTGLASYCLYETSEGRKPTLLGAVLSAAGGAAAGVLPDVFEPADNPNHRSTMHSVSLLGVGAIGVKRYIERPDVSLNAKRAAVVLGSGYASHLVADSTTPKGLPLL